MPNLDEIRTNRQVYRVSDQRGLFHKSGKQCSTIPIFPTLSGFSGCPDIYPPSHVIPIAGQALANVQVDGRQISVGFLISCPRMTQNETMTLSGIRLNGVNSIRSSTMCECDTSNLLAVFIARGCFHSQGMPLTWMPYVSVARSLGA